MKKTFKYLGQIVSQEDYRADPENIKSIVSLKERTPKTVGEVWQLMGLLGYYRRYIENFSCVAKPIYDLLKYDSKCRPGKKQQPKEKCRPKRKTHQVPPSPPVSWSDKHQRALNFLIDCPTSPHVMAYPDYEIPFVLHTDASQEGLGAVLYQKQQRRMRVIGYASGTLTPAETKYHLHSGKLEFLALKWAITEHFGDYLFYASDFMVITH